MSALQGWHQVAQYWIEHGLAAIFFEEIDGWRRLACLCLRAVMGLFIELSRVRAPVPF